MERMASDFHAPVMLHECIEGLAIKPDGIYVDGTFGGGGHSTEIEKRLEKGGVLYGFDQDEEVLQRAPDLGRLKLFHNNFRDIEAVLRLEGVTEVDGILVDLGVSSLQLDKPEKGFSYRFDSPLDMRMNANAERSAQVVLNQYDVEELRSVFKQYSDIVNPGQMARGIVKAREIKTLERSGDLVAVVDACKRGDRLKYMSQVFQAVRMEVNDELGALRMFLESALRLLKPGGRLVVLTFHSIEDRVVKYFTKNGNFEGKHDADEYGRIYRPFKLINKKPIMASQEELKMNNRARSAKLRIAEKV